MDAHNGHGFVRRNESLSPPRAWPIAQVHKQDSTKHQDLNMETQRVKTCFTITFTDEQYSRAKGYIEDMKKHPGRIFWQGKQGKTDDELIIEQIAHRILSGFYNNEPYNAAKHIMRMDSSIKVNGA